MKRTTENRILIEILILAIFCLFVMISLHEPTKHQKHQKQFRYGDYRNLLYTLPEATEEDVKEALAQLPPLHQ